MDWLRLAESPMSTRNPQSIRNVTLVGHSDTGKTTLAETLLARSGTTQRAGSVKDGTSIFDYEADEKAAGHSIDAACGYYDHDGHRVNLIDTPGYPDYIGEAVTGYRAADLALICVSATSGIQVNTLRTWAFGRGTRHARAIVVTRCDQAEGQLADVLEKIRGRLGKRCIPWNAPEEVGDFTQEWTEAVVEADEDLLGRYLEGEEISIEDLDRVAKPAVCQSIVVPVLFVSAETGMGMDNLMQFINELGPSPVDAPRKLVDPMDADDVTPLQPDAARPFVGLVWGIRHDRHVGKKAFVQVAQGTLEPGMTVINSRTRAKERIGHLFELQGKDQTDVKTAIPGESVMLPKLEGLQVGDTLSTENLEGIIRTVPSPDPMFSLAIVTSDPGQEAKVSEALGKISEDSPTVQVHRDPVTHELLASGMSQLHLDTVLKRLKERYGIEVQTKKPKVAYRESIVGKATGKFRHKKQSGGRGQFAEVVMEISPGEPGSGLTYEWKIVGGVIPRNYEPAIEKGIREKMQTGIIAGYPLDDVHVKVTDGSFHDVDSSEAAFKLAGGRAFSEGIQAAKPVILEPMASLEIHIPLRSMGDVSSDLSTRRGRIIGMDQDGEAQVIEAEMPLSETADYSQVLNAMTSGEGDFSMKPHGYERVPNSVQSDLVAAHQPAAEAEA